MKVRKTASRSKAIIRNAYQEILRNKKNQDALLSVCREILELVGAPSSARELGLLVAYVLFEIDRQAQFALEDDEEAQDNLASILILVKNQI